MRNQIKTDEELTNLDRPIDLHHVDRQSFLFYLAGRSPLSVPELASECKRQGQTIPRVLANQFKQQINVDQTGFVQLTDAAKPPVISHSKRFIEQHNQIADEADSLKEDGDLKSAAAEYQRAGTLLASVRGYLESVNYSSEKLDNSISRAWKNHDDTRKRHAKGVYEHRRLSADKYEQRGEKAIQDGDLETAETAYSKAKEALQEALHAISQYNNDRIVENTPLLSTDTVDQSLTELDKKRDRAADKINEQSRSVSTEDAESLDSDSTDSLSSDSPTKTDLISAIDELANTLSRAPTATEMKTEGRLSPQLYYKEFGTWNDALGHAAIDVEADIILDIQHVDEKLYRQPAQADLDRHGEYDGQWCAKYFGGWKNALDAADVNSPTNKELINEIQRLDEQHQGLPTSQLMRNEGRYASKRIRDRFDSWDKALNAAGIEKRQRLIDEIHRINSECQGRPTTTVINDIGFHSSGYFAGEFGSWKEAVAAAGISPDEKSADSLATSVSDNPSEQQLLTELRRLDKVSEQMPVTTQMRDEGKYNPMQYFDQFGSWDEALEEAGVNKRERLVEELNRLDRNHDSQPDPTICEDHSQFTPGYFINEFNSWSKALESAGILSDTTAVQQGTRPKSDISTADTESTSKSSEQATEPSESITSDPEPAILTVDDIDDGVMYDDPIAGRLIGYITQSRDETTAKLHFEDRAGDEFWLNVFDEQLEDIQETGNWFLISQFRGAKDSSGGKWDKALQTTPESTATDEGTIPSWNNETDTGDTPDQNANSEQDENMQDDEQTGNDTITEKTNVIESDDDDQKTGDDDLDALIDELDDGLDELV